MVSPGIGVNVPLLRMPFVVVVPATDETALTYIAIVI
jgi:hypothetical protein